MTQKLFKPTFVWQQSFLKTLLVYSLLMGFLALSDRQFTELLVPVFIGLAGVFILSGFLTYLCYRQTDFCLEPFFIQKKINFLFSYQESIHYKDIKEVLLYQWPFQKLFGLGTIRLISHATTHNAGIKLCNLKNYQEIGAFLMDQIKR